ncbi:microfibril-associated glycoprotein 4-like isoform X1 [Trematomus bernacchii]|uniref:microfibril-associated glycoprotein 4-like isoform X1 n=1 Tax=Trematomus bernacchii TaxID=40690 RepID=UPI00146F77E3|nr:microfibril-associated glycoprotein 4-like isoform X1 [Trematomus bernacchii]
MKMLQVTLFVALLGFSASAPTGSKDFLPIDCNDIYCHDNTSSSGVYTIFPGGPTAPLPVYCDMKTDGGRWTVFLIRMDGTENFYRPWSQYKKGFGNVAGEYWLGLDIIFLLTQWKENELRVDMEDWEGGKADAKYSSFSINSENDGYQLHLGKFNGGNAGWCRSSLKPVLCRSIPQHPGKLRDASSFSVVQRSLNAVRPNSIYKSLRSISRRTGQTGDSLTNHNNMKFTTFDRDQDTWPSNCAQRYLGGFWYSACHYANPTGLYAPQGLVNYYGNVQVIWSTWKGWNYGLKTLAMKIRSVSACACAQ